MMTAAFNDIASGLNADPFAVLGRHQNGDEVLLRTFAPGADRIDLLSTSGKKPIGELSKVKASDFFEIKVSASILKEGYRYCAWFGDLPHIHKDTYSFPPSIPDLDLYLLSEGKHAHAFRYLGAHVMEQDGVKGTRFAVWAPNARSVCLAADFNLWSNVKHPMATRGGSGVWELFVPDIGEGTVYKYVIRNKAGQLLPFKADPFGFGAEMRPKSASVVRDLSNYEWDDHDWLANRWKRHERDTAISIYEVHLGSWKRKDGEGYLSYAELTEQLIPYVKGLGFTHIEVMPITEHPFDGSWGYQPIGMFAPTRRHGTPAEFKAFVDAIHDAGLGIILDWVPGHFPSDEHGLAQFDGTHLYEHADPRKGFHPDWNTLIFNFGRREVINYLVSNARFWLEEYHLDGLRVDAVASMLYLDYSREEGEWLPNSDGSNENWEAVKFLQSFNADAYSELDGVPGGIFTIAEESTAWPGVTAPTNHNGLGFGYKWNMGWMNDTLSYMSENPVNRRHHHHMMTFGIDYAFSENYILPLSHDEVVHGKGSLIDRMPGDRWQKHANLRAYYGFMWTHPGKKLLFMGCEFAQVQEWDADSSLDWHLTEYPEHASTQQLITDLNTLYKGQPALYEQDCVADGFNWIDGGAQNDNVLSYVRWDKARQQPCLIICNFSPLPRDNYRVGVPLAGYWSEALNTDSNHYGGSGVGNLGGFESENQNANGLENSLSLKLPPLSTSVFVLKR